MAKKEKQRKKLRDLPDELIWFFVRKAALFLIYIIATVLFAIFLKIPQGIFILSIFTLGYGLYNLYLLYGVLHGQYKEYMGVFEKKEAVIIGNEKKPIFSGPVSALLNIPDSGQKISMNVNSNFNPQEGDWIRIYAKDTDIYKKNDNTFVINNPLLYKIAKK